jgi:hypothetical protein
MDFNFIPCRPGWNQLEILPNLVPGLRLVSVDRLESMEDRIKRGNTIILLAWRQHGGSMDEAWMYHGQCLKPG